MFEIGRDYKIVTGSGDSEAWSVYKVLSYDAPLLVVDAYGQEYIFNTHSPNFVSAEKQLTEAETAALPKLDIDFVDFTPTR